METKFIHNYQDNTLPRLGKPLQKREFTNT